jgi:superfamily II DNA or RNA helicase/HKD family nuclease
MTTLDSVLNLPDDTRMLDVVRLGLERADDVRIAVSFTRCSGLGLLIDPLRSVMDRGGKVRLLTSTYQAVTQPEALETLRSMPGLDTRVQSGPVGFHTKFWWFGAQTQGECWAGSSNLSKGGLASNLEWNLRRVDPQTMATTKAQFEDLWVRDDVRSIDDDFLRAYRRTYEAERNKPGAMTLFVADTSPSIVPNGAQLEALARLEQLRDRGERRAAVVAATGIGKTYLAAFDVLRSGARTALYVSHRLEHLLQARRAFARIMPSRSMGVVGGGWDESDTDIVFASVGSLARRPDLLARPFEYLVIDEFHHAEAPSYGVLRQIRDRAFLLGITATPERQDGHDVLEWCDWNVAYEVRLPEAIDHGWLLPFHYFGIADETVDFATFPWRHLDQIEDLLSIDSRAAHVLQHALERGFDGDKRATIGFCAGIRHATFMAEAFVRRGQNAVAVLGTQGVSEREAIYARLADPKDSLQWLFVSDILNEGVDLPFVNSVLFLRPTESATLFLQQLGRGLRLYPGTEVLTVLDFVGHHRSAWLTLNALDAPSGGGRRTEIADGVVIKPPRSCEVVLQQRTREILSKISRFATRREACDEAYRRVRAELARPVLPVDIWNRVDVPELSTFRQAYGSWLACQEAHGDAPAWSRSLAEEHTAFALLRAVESDWQALRVSPYALAWGLCATPDQPELGYAKFFERWPQWSAERSPLNGSKTWDTVRRKLGVALVEDRLEPLARAALGSELLTEVESRLLYNVNSDHKERHGGVLRSPADLNLFAQYSRPEIVRHFGNQYDPARHNMGILWFGDDGVIITKLDTSGALKRHQYANRILDAKRFSWTSQNKMSTENEAGRTIVNHSARALRLHLFVQPRSHTPAYYFGGVRVVSAEGLGPMSVIVELERELPPDLLLELLAAKV